MASNNAEIKWTSDDAAVVRAFEKIERNMDTLSRKMEGLERTSKKTADESEKGFGKVAGSIMRAGHAIIGGGGIIAGLHMWSKANQKLIEEADQAAQKYDELGRKFRIQAGLTKLELEEAQKAITKTAFDNAVDAETAHGVATTLIGAGATTEEATGGSLNAILRATAAANIEGKEVDANDFAGKVASYLKSQNMTVNTDNIEAMAVAATRTMAVSDFKLDAFGQLAKQGGALRGYLAPEEQLAYFAALGDVMPAEEAGTNLRNIVQRLATAREMPNRVKALERIGLSPDQVDLVGENLATVLNRLEKGMEGLPQEEQAGVAVRLFEEAGVAGFKALLGQRGRIPEMVAAQRDTAAFDEAVTVGQTGAAAFERRATVRVGDIHARKSQGDDQIVKAIYDYHAKEGGLLSHLVAPIDAYRFKTLRGVGFSVETALGDGTGQMRGRHYRDIMEHAGELAGPGGETGAISLDERIREAREHTEALRENTQALLFGGRNPRVRVPPAANLNGGGIR